MTMSREDELAAAWGQFNARMILLTIAPKDVLCIVGHALRLLADLRAPEGQTLLPLLVGLRDAAQKTLASAAKVQGRLTFPDPEDVAVAPSATDDAPETDDDDPGPPVWTEEWVECCAVAGPGAPGNLAPLTEFLLHYLSGAGAVDDVLSLGVQMPKVDDADQRLATHLLDGFRGVLRKHMLAAARS
jgi:hypothetical protein